MGLISNIFNNTINPKGFVNIDLMDAAQKAVATTVVKEPEPDEEDDEEPEEPEQETYQQYTFFYKDKTRPNEVYDRVEDTDRDDDFFTLIFNDEDGNICRQHMIAIGEIFRVDIVDISVPVGRG